MGHSGRLIGVRRVDIEPGAVEPWICNFQPMDIVLAKSAPPAVTDAGVTENAIGTL